MTTILNLTCPICSEQFRNNENIHSTQCGHILHYNCLENWRLRSDSCPQCRTENPRSHKIYFCFDESAETAENIKELKNKLDIIKKDFDGLKNDLATRETEVSDLRDKEIELIRKHTDAMRQQQNEKKCLEINVKQLEEKCTKQLQEIDKLVEELESFKMESSQIINKLKIDKERSQITINSIKETLTARIEQLETDLENSDNKLYKEIEKNSKMSRETVQMQSIQTGSETILYMEKNKLLEQKLKHITEEFEKEINKNTQLEIDNMKLKSFVNTMKSPNGSSLNENSQMLVNRENEMTTKKQSPRNKEYRRRMLSPSPSTLRSATSSESINSKKGRTYNFFDSSSNSIVIQKYPASNLQYPLESVVILIGNNLGINLNKSEIDKVNIVKAKSKKIGDLVSLFVRFKTKEMKSKFLAVQQRLLASDIPYLRRVNIKEYIDDGSQNLYVYAKMRLKDHGFQHVFWTNNQIFAKHNVSDERGIRILNCEQVDELVRKSKEELENILI